MFYLSTPGAGFFQITPEKGSIKLYFFPTNSKVNTFQAEYAYLAEFRLLPSKEG